MKTITSLCLVVVSLGFIGSCYGETFLVGGKDGWVLDPRESYNRWAERSRFQVNDTLVFKYTKGLDSVLVVNEEAYHSCNKTNPKEALEDAVRLQGFLRTSGLRAPAPAPTSGVASIGLEGSVRLIMGLGLIWL
ncbi:early nodulin-like protein 1 [Tanacetum coccineum]